MSRLILFLLIASLAFTSCSNKRLIYLQNSDVVFYEDEKDSLYPKTILDYKLQVNDVLNIKVKTTNEKVNTIFNGNQSSQTYGGNNQRYEDRNTYLNGYTISDSGYVKLPILGFFKVVDKTLNQTNKLLQKSADQYLEDATVITKLMNFKITFMGEFNEAGVINFYQEKLNILEGLTQAGGISDYGNKKYLLVIRQLKEGNKTFRVDLTDRNILATDLFYLMPNDIVYAEPVRSKSIRVFLSEYSLILTTITSTITSILLVANILK